MIVRTFAVCVAAAMICAALRTQRPELATAVSLAIGVAVLGMLAAQYAPEFSRLTSLWREMTGMGGDAGSAIVRAAGIAIVSELGAQLCADAGERALAGRVTLAARAAILALCLPLLAELGEALSSLA